MSLPSCLLKKVVTEFFAKSFSKKWFLSNEFILYKIVDAHSKEGIEYYKIQCINTKAVFDMTLQDIVFDMDILYGLHPAQGCYIGLEYATNMKNLGVQEKPKAIFSKYSACRYGKNNLLYQNRNGFLGFECNQTGDQFEFVLDPRDIALSKAMIEEFDAVQAFCIGVLAGIKLLNQKENADGLETNKTPYLRLVKNDG